MMDLTEQIARALFSEKHKGVTGAWELVSPTARQRYLALAKAVLPFIAAERERCAVIAEQHARDAWKIGHAEGQNDACSSGRNHGARAIAAAIRSQQP